MARINPSNLRNSIRKHFIKRLFEKQCQKGTSEAENAENDVRQSRIDGCEKSDDRRADSTDSGDGGTEPDSSVSRTKNEINLSEKVTSERLGKVLRSRRRFHHKHLK